MAEVTWSPRAILELEDICHYIANDSQYYAALFAQRIINLVENIHDFPLAGRIVPEYQRDNLRERLFQNYRVVYRISQYKIEIVSIVHGARLLSGLG